MGGQGGGTGWGDRVGDRIGNDCAVLGGAVGRVLRFGQFVCVGGRDYMLGLCVCEVLGPVSSSPSDALLPSPRESITDHY